MTGEWIPPFPFEETVFNPGNKGIDLHSHYGRTFGGSVDLSWTIGRALDVWIGNHMIENKREPFDINEWATRKESQAPGLVVAGILNLADAALFRYAYPKLGKALYNNTGFYAAWMAGKALVNGAIVWYNWEMLKESN